ncbi:related to Chromatin structure-remodeling complex protein RSC8 [Nakaseomyces glabratus]|nr:SWIRM domain [Nakaseomyces glabratus]QNG14981.1 uncharacterized protein GWK60_J02453 [Nakaseomyces glabratus]SCV17362.1 related to Chromatin structure-remodeling complex protein RSC8 [Nakaseomyces glabratus]SLM17155.1 related to Chromatin structure-remodeling complex protein RSC8 [Nakaseomyces glabratus]
MSETVKNEMEIDSENVARVEAVTDKSNGDDDTSSMEDKTLKFLIKQTNEVTIPPFAKWFDMYSVHEIEKRSLPDFFDGSSRFKSEKAYKDTRNFIINTFRLSPTEYLTITAVRRNIAMDVASIVRIHEFLEKWGLINYQVDPRSKPTLIGPSFTGHFQITLDTPQGLKPFLPEKKIIANKKLKIEAQKKKLVHEDEERVEVLILNDATTKESNEDDQTINEEENSYPTNVSLRQNVYDASKNFNALKEKKLESKDMQKVFVCHICGNDKMTVKYFNLRNKHSSLCHKCFSKEQFGERFQSSDFIKLADENAFPQRKIWTDQEVVSLLEGLEMFGSDWKHIAKHVGGNKLIADCVDKYMSLPLEDDDVSKLLDKYKSSANQTTSDTIIEVMENFINALITNGNEDILNSKLPTAAHNCQLKSQYQMRIIAQELITLSAKKLKIKMSKLDSLDKALTEETAKYENEVSKISQQKNNLGKQVCEINQKLSDLNVTKKLVIASEQMDSNMDLVDKEEEEEKNDNQQLAKEVAQHLDDPKLTEPKRFKIWSL